jgi:hypothetical protein
MHRITETALTPDALSTLAESDPPAAARLLAAYDGPGLLALAEQCVATFHGRDDIHASVSFLLGAWEKRRLISMEQFVAALVAGQATRQVGG